MPGFIAVTRPVSAAMNRCELTHLERQPIDVAKAREQHAAYERALETAAHCRIVRAGEAPGLPDSVFVEDTAIVLDEVAIITRPGAASRREETAGVAEVLRKYRALQSIDAPATIDGGDVIVCGRRVFIGRTSRTNDEGIRQVRRILAPFGYSVHGVEVRGCLHLKSAAAAVAETQLLINPDRMSRDDFPGIDFLVVDPREPDAANILKAGDDYLYSSAFPRTREMLERSVTLTVLDMSELAKAEGAMTCCSVVFRAL
jgi:dimethylargininase